MRCLPVLAAAALAASALADVNLNVRNGDKVSGTFDPGFETETFRVRLPAGAALTIVAKGKRPRGAPSGPAPRIQVFDPDDVELAIGLPVDSPTGTRLDAFAITRTGEHRVVVASEGGVAGDYQFQAAWKPATKLALEGFVGDTPTPFGVSADAGAVVTVQVAPSPGSPARPWVSAVNGPGFSQSFPQPPISSTRVRISTSPLPAAMDLVVDVRNQAAQGGDVRITATVKAPKPSKRKVDITSATLTQEANGDSTLRGGVLGPDGGLLDLTDQGSGIDGAAVNVPANALTTPTTIFVGTGEAIPGTGGQSATGPTIVFGPDGQKFAEAVTITIPFDPGLLDGGTGAIQVFSRDKKGKVTQVPGPFTVDAVAGTVSFPSSHFSEYRAFGPRRVSPRDITGDGIDELIIPAPFADSGRGAVYVFPGRSDIAGGKLSDAPIVVTGLNAVQGTTPGDTFGAAVATGDVNADGIADLVVGATRANRQGLVYVFLGATDFATRDAGSANAKLTPTVNDLRFGATVVVEDATGDGVADVLVGAPYGSPYEFETGAVYLFRGGTGFGTTAADDANVLAIHGEAMSSRLGVAIAVGDLTGDDKPDIAAGSDGLGMRSSGSVHVLQDPAQLVSPVVAGLTGITLRGTRLDDQFGAAIAIGDLDQDGTDDLAVGAPGADYQAYGSSTFEYEAGAVYVFTGSPAFDNRDAEAADYPIHGFDPTTGDLLGSSIDVANVLGDAAPDLLIGIPGDDENSPEAGALKVIRGDRTFDTNHSVQFGEQLRDRLGVVLPPADVNGDGRLDTIVIAGGANSGAGLVRVFLGPSIFGRSFVVTGTAGIGLGERDVAPDFAPKR